MSDVLEISAPLLVPLLLLAVAFLAGNVMNSRHEKSLLERQQNLSHIRTTDLDHLLDADPTGNPATLFTAEISLGVDHFRGALGSLKNIFGGEIRSYQQTLDRARREAILRLVEQADLAGFNAIANIRLEFADISGSAHMAKRPAMVTIMAYGTAYTTHRVLSGDTASMTPAPITVF